MMGADMAWRVGIDDVDVEVGVEFEFGVGVEVLPTSDDAEMKGELPAPAGDEPVLPEARPATSGTGVRRMTVRGGTTGIELVRAVENEPAGEKDSGDAVYHRLLPVVVRWTAR